MSFAADLAKAIFGQDFTPPPSGGILYVEDFDAPVAPGAAADPAPEPPVRFTAAELEAAHAAGRKEGQQEALREAMLIQAQLQSAATQTLADALGANRATLERAAAGAAESAARLALAALTAALPRTMQNHGAAELRAVVEALLPGLRAEPELRVRANPTQADFVRDLLTSDLAGGNSVVSVAADPALQPGDIVIAWAEGDARRNASDIYRAIRTALAPLQLPDIEDFGRGK